jgi:hypothetical protein
MSDEPKSAEQLSAQWWNAWRKSDFSWEGLATKTLEGWFVGADGVLGHGEPQPDGARQATLQDYWRDQSDHLITGDGKRWTRVHLPIAWSDGSPTGKADWSEEERRRFNDLITARVRAGRETKFKGEASGYQRVEGADMRAQLQGAVLFNATPLRTGAEEGIHVSLRHSAFLKQADLAGIKILGFADCADMLFAGGARLADTFQGAANLRELICLGELSIRPGSFASDVVMSEAEFADAVFVFSQAFGGSANMNNSRFHKLADFDGARFPKETTFISARFYDDARFSSGEFADSVNYNWAEFHKRASFDWTTFRQQAFLNRVTVHGEASFQSAAFEGDVGMAEMTLKDDCSFAEATILGKLSFNASLVHGKCYFNKASFRRSKDTKEGGLFFEASRFCKLVDFDGVTFPSRPQNFSGAFVGCRFEDWVDFRRTGTHWIAALDEAMFGSKVLLDDPDEEAAGDEFRNVMLGGVAKHAKEEAASKAAAAREERALAATQATRRAAHEAKEKNKSAPRPVTPKPVTQQEIETWELDTAKLRLKELEGGCRAIKVAMGRERDELLEQRYYRFQLMARRRQKGVPFWEKFFSDLYALFSDYGASMTRPFVAMFFMVLSFALVFWMWWNLSVAGVGPAPLSAWVDGSLRFDPSFFEALRFSASRLLPFGAFGGDATRWPWLAELIEAQGPVTGFWVRFVASLESVFALVLVFLFALAVRRRFQIG